MSKPSRAPVIAVTDLGERGARVIKDAVALASAMRSPVVVAAAPSLQDEGPTRRRPRSRSLLLGELDEQLRAIALPDTPCERVLLGADALAELVGIATERAARAIVVASPAGRPFWAVRRSLVERLVRACPRPVMVTGRTRAPIRPEVLVVARDLARAESGDLEAAARVAALGHPRLLACFVGEPGEPQPSFRHGGATIRAAEAIADRLRSFGVSILPDDVHLMPFAPARAIVDLAERHDADLIVIGSHAHTGVRRVLLGGVPERVARIARCAVLSLPLDVTPEARARRAPGSARLPARGPRPHTPLPFG